MLNESLFTVISLKHADGHIDAQLQIDQQHEIFTGHFPDHPVVPGACMLQTVKEVLADVLKIKLGLVRADNIKFIALVEPATSLLQLSINYQQVDDDVKVSATLLAAETICMKLQGVFAAYDLKQ